MNFTDKSKNILVVLLASAALTALTLVALMSETAPVGASQAVFLQGAADNVSIAKSAATRGASGNNSVVYNGETITYTITITNNSASSSATNVSIQDTLPKDALDDIQCLGGCGRVVDTSLIPEPTGGTVVVTMTRQLTWTVDALAPRESRQVVFWGRVKGQADGTLLTNRAFVRYDLGGSTQSADSNDVQTTVRVQIGQSGQPSLSPVPTWFSDDLGGTIGQDWGDFDRDGNLDLALGSSVGTSVYWNESGQLSKYIVSARQTYGVAWGDFNGDGQLELAAVGESLDHTPATSGTNFIYSYKPATDAFFQSGSFVSDRQLVRVIAGDFRRAGVIDLIASSNAYNSSCPVRLYRNDGNGNFSAGPGDCISQFATAAVGAADFDNDGDLDLALGLFPHKVRLFINDGQGLFSQTLPIDLSVAFLPYDFKWGDYDGDGYLDLAAAFPLMREVRVYHNRHGTGFDAPIVIRTRAFLTPLSVDWGNFTGEGRLDLAVGDAPPQVYRYASGSFSSVWQLPAGAVKGQVWSVRGVRVFPEGALNLALTNRDGPSTLFDALPARLSHTLLRIDSAPAASVAWGDAGGDADLDVMFGAGGSPAVGTRILYNENWAFPPEYATTLMGSGLGPQNVALGDVNGDGALDIAVGNVNQTQVFMNGASENTSPVWATSLPAASKHVAAWGDANGDGRLDLLSGGYGGPVYLFLNREGQLKTTPAFVTAESSQVTSLAWCDVDGDGYLDFVVGNEGQPSRLYHNNAGYSFTPVWNSTFYSKTTSIACADFNGDSRPDLALGNYGQGVTIFENQQGALGAQPVWTSPTFSQTTSLAWGDWNNDGYPELAVGNDGEPTQVFANLNSVPGSPRLFWAWTSDEAYHTTGVAWGDYNMDGGLDLAISQNGGGWNGVYANTTVVPSHVTGIFTPTLLLPNNPSYVWVKRPGNTWDAYYNSSSELLSGPLNPTVTVHYKLYNPDGTRAVPDSNVPGTPVALTIFEYSLGGGSTWKPATEAISSPTRVTTTTRMGQEAVFVWNAQKDQAISDNARFRVRIVSRDLAGLIQRSSASAISPPFRVRGTTCVWPEEPTISYLPDNPKPNTLARFTAGLRAVSGVFTFTWDFGDGSEFGHGAELDHIYADSNRYVVTLTVSGEACPINRDQWVTTTITVGNGVPSQKVFLPLVLNRFSTIARTQWPGESDGPQQPYAWRTAKSRLGWAEWMALFTVSRLPERLPIAALSRSQLEPDPLRLQSLAPASDCSLSRFAVSNSSYNDQPSIGAGGDRVAFWSTNELIHNAEGSIEIFQALMDAAGNVTYTQVTSSTGSVVGGFNLSPSSNTQGDRIAFFSERNLVGGNADGNFEIFLARIGSGGAVSLTQLTNTTVGANVWPAINADGDRITFASDLDLTGQNPDGNFEIFLAQVDANGSASFTQITGTGDGSNDHPKISADGARIAFVSNRDLDVTKNTDGNQEIFLATLGGAGTAITFTQITSSAGGINEQVALNADGSRMAFISDRDLTGQNPNFIRQVFLAAVDSGKVDLTQLTHSTDGYNDQPVINGDGTRIAYVSSDQAIMLRDTVLGVPIQIAAGGGNDNVGPSINASGTDIAFISEREAWRASCPMADVALGKFADTKVDAGQSLTYTLVVTNLGPSVATNVLLQDSLPSGLRPLVQPDQTDDDNDPSSGFGGAVTQTRTTWSAPDSWLTLDLSQLELPDPTSPSQWTDMSGNTLLLHLNEPLSATTFSDSSGNGSHGTCSGGACPAAGVGGRFRTGTSFNVSQSVQLPAPLDYAQVTLMAWINSTNTNSSYNAILANKPTGCLAGLTGYAFAVNRGNTDDRSLALEFGSSVSGCDSIATGAGAIPKGTWTFVAATLDNVNHTARLYVNGTLRAERTGVTHTLGITNATLGVFGGLYPFYGRMDEAAVYNRALSPQEINRIYQYQAQAVELPDRTSPSQWMDMSGNVLLMHFNELTSTYGFSDTSSSPISGTCTVGGCPTAGVPGKLDLAGNFAGANSIRLGQPGKLNFQGLVSLAAWVRSQATDGIRNIISRGYNPLPQPSAVYLRLRNGNYQVGSGDDGERYASSPIPSGDTGNWVHLVGVHDGTAWRLYRNGVLVSSIGDVVGAVVGAQDWMIGARDGGAEFFQGDIDEVAIFDRGLSAEEVLEMYNRQLPNYAGYAGSRDSRVMDGYRPVAWETLAWTPQRPMGKDLPDNGQAEVGYPSGAVTMTGNVLLLHLNDSNGATTFADSSGTGKLVTCLFCPAAGVMGKFGSAVRFDGTTQNQYALAMDPDSPVSYTIEAWVKPMGTGSGNILLRTNSNGYSTLSHQLKINSAGRFEHYTFDGSGKTVAGSTPIAPGLWYHVAGVAANGGAMRLYVNGVEEGAAAKIGSLWSAGDRWQLGSGSAGGIGYLNGVLDEVAIFDRALSAPEIYDHYTRGVLRLQYQARTCGVITCTDSPDMAGPGGPYTFYSELANTLPGLPGVSITVPSRQYFQYRAYLATDDAAIAPQLKSVTIGPSHDAISPSQGQCSVTQNMDGSQNADCTLGHLSPNATATVTLYAEAADTARGVLVNDATVSRSENDRNPANDHASTSTQVRADTDLAVSEFGVGDTAIAGATFTYTVVITNYGPKPATNVLLIDRLPVSTTLQSTDPPSYAPAGGIVRFWLGTLTATQVMAIRVTVAISPALRGGIITNTVSVSSDESDSDPANNVDTLASRVTALTDLWTRWSESPFQASAGEPLTYTISMGNYGPSQATGMILTDTMPGGAGFQRASPGYSLAGGDVGWGWPALDPNTGVTFTLVITVDAAARFSVHNVSVVAGAETEITTTNNTWLRPTVVKNTADLSVTKSAYSDTVLAGTALTYTILVTNAGPSYAANVVLSDALPSGLDSIVVKPSQGLCDVTTGIFTCTLDTGPNLLVNPGAETGNLSGWTSLQNGGNGWTTTTVGVYEGRYAFITSYGWDRRSQEVDLLASGLSASYLDTAPRINVSEWVRGSWPNYADRYYVRAELRGADHNLITSWSAGSVASPLYATANWRQEAVSFTGYGSGARYIYFEDGGYDREYWAGWYGTVLDAASVTVGNPVSPGTYTVTVGATIPSSSPAGTLTNSVGVSTSDDDPNPSNNRHTLTTTVKTESDLTVSKSAPTLVWAGEWLTYTLNVTNTGPSDASGVAVTDSLPVSVTFISASNGCANLGGTNTVMCTIGALSALSGQNSRVFTIIVNIPSSLPHGTVLTNTARIGGDQADPNASNNNSSTVTTVVNRRADLAIVKSASDATVYAGNHLTYTLNITNSGPSDASDVTITDTLPAPATFASASSGCGYSALQQRSTVICRIDALPSSGLNTRTITIAVTVLASTAYGTLLPNRAIIGATEVDLVADNNTSAVTTTVQTRADVELVKTDSPDPVIAGAPLTYTLTITNHGPSDARTVIVTDTLPPGVNFYQNPVVYNLGTLPGGATVSLTFTVTVSSAAPALALTNVATVTTTTTDPGVYLNTAQTTTTVQTRADLVITKSDQPDPVLVGGKLTYTLVITNAGPSDAANVRVTDTLPISVTALGDAALLLRLDELAEATSFGDASGYGNNGTCSAPNCPVAGVGGRFGTALQFNGASSTVSATLVTSAQDNVSLSAWVYWNAPILFPFANQVVLYNGNTAANGYGLIVSVPNQLSIWLNGAPALPSTSLLVGDWQHLVAVRRNGVWELYVNGFIRSSGNGNQNPPTGGTFIGSNNAGAESFNGSIDEVGIYNRALSASEINDLYTTGLRNWLATSLGVCDIGNGRITCDAGTLTSGEVASATVQVQVDPDAAGILTNTALVTSPVSDLVPGNNTATITTTIQTQADLALTKTASALQQHGSVAAGERLTYTLVITNNGQTNAANLTVTDTLPSGVTLASAPGCSGTTNLVCPISSLPRNNSQMFTIVVTVNSSTSAGTLVNTAGVTSTANVDPSPTNNADLVTTTVQTRADLRITKSDSPDPVVAGTTLTYTLAYTNGGPSDAQAVYITDTLPASVTFGGVASETPPMSGPTRTDQVCTWYTPTLVSGASGRLVFTVTVGRSVVSGTNIANNVVITSTTQDAVANNAFTETTTVRRQSDLEIVKNASSGVVMAGAPLTYTLVVTNHGPSDVSGVTVTDTLPTGTSLSSVTSSQGCTTLPCSLGDLAQGAHATITAVVAISSSTPSGTLTNTAGVTGTSFDPGVYSNTGQVTTTVLAETDLAITKTASHDHVTAGTTLTYTLVVTNTGLADAQAVTITDTLPVTVSFASASSGCGHLAGTVTCALGTLPASVGNSRAITIAVTVPTTATHNSLLPNTARVGASSSLINTQDDTVEITTTVERQADLSVSKSSVPAIPTAGSPMTYTILITNTGPSQATGVALTDTLPADVQSNPHPTATPSQGTCQVAVLPVTCALGELNLNATATVTIVATVRNHPSGVVLTNTVRASGNEFDPTTPNVYTVTNLLRAEADLAIAKSAPGTVLAGDWLTYTLVITNIAGPSDVVSATVTDTLPMSVTFVPSQSSGSWTESGSALTTTIDYLTATQSVTYTVVVSVPSTMAAGTVLTNTAGVTKSGVFDPSQANNRTLPVTTTVQTQADLSITKVASSDPTSAGRALTYTLSVTNAGPSVASAITVTDDVSAGMVMTASSSGGWACGFASQSVTCTLASLAVGPGPAITVVITAPASAGVMTNTASITSTTPDLDLSNNVAQITTTVDVITPTSMTITPTSAISGTNETFTATISPISASFPLTYTWLATGKTLETHAPVFSLIDTLVYSWTITETQVITVTADNIGGSLTSTQSVTITMP